MFIPFHDDNPAVRIPVATFAIIAANVISLVWFNGLSPERSLWVQYHRGFVPARIAQWFHPQPLFVPFEQPVRGPFGMEMMVPRRLALPPARGEIALSLLTCMFLHGGWMHLIGNMWFLWLFGNSVEGRLGPILFPFLYLLGGLLASACYWLVTPNSMAPVIGASGAVAVVLGAYAITWPWARVHTLVFLFVFVTVIDLPALLFLGVWFLGQVAAGTEQLKIAAGGGVAWWAHVGGFLAGMLMMPFLNIFVRPPTPYAVRDEEPCDGFDRWDF